MYVATVGEVVNAAQLNLNGSRIIMSMTNVCMIKSYTEPNPWAQTTAMSMFLLKSS